jgi:hypothetical protein
VGDDPRIVNDPEIDAPGYLETVTLDLPQAETSALSVISVTTTAAPPTDGMAQIASCNPPELELNAQPPECAFDVVSVTVQATDPDTGQVVAVISAASDVPVPPEI